MLSDLISGVIGALFAVAGVAMGLGCWYAYRALHPRVDQDGRTDGGRTTQV